MSQREHRFAAVVFDIGETLLDRTREYAAWAEFFGVPAHTFSAVFGAMIARGASVSDVLDFFGDGVDASALFARRAAADGAVVIDDRDLYPDVRAVIRDLHELGYVVGIAGNQPAMVSEQLRALELGADFLGSSSEWRIAKPSPEFFLHAASEAGALPADTVYVGDQLDNDVVAPQRAGLTSVRILRGPWGCLNRDADAEAGCLAIIRSLTELPGLLGVRQNHR
ncbi:MAG TPA: HAD family hydrolase [Galbitalea sp.]|jgi:FMN phosphatase YigB (HAD superfamily)|nr:HAD family hydrolase [Galbitalea sp.]